MRPTGSACRLLRIRGSAGDTTPLRAAAHCARCASVSLTVAPREFLGIVGESGSGKTQLFLSILGSVGAHARASGSVRFAVGSCCGCAPPCTESHPRLAITMVFQDPMTSLDAVPAHRGAAHRGLGVHRGCSLARCASARAIEMLERVHVPETGTSPAPISARVVRRHAPARHDRHAPLCEPAVPARRRADHRPRRHRSGADHRAAARAAGRIGNVHDADQPRSRRRGGVGGPHRRDVCRSSGGGSPASELFQRARHPYTALLFSAFRIFARSGSSACHVSPGQPPSPTMSGAGLRVRSALSACGAGCHEERPALRAVERPLNRSAAASGLPFPVVAVTDPLLKCADWAWISRPRRCCTM